MMISEAITLLGDLKFRQIVPYLDKNYLVIEKDGEITGLYDEELHLLSTAEAMSVFYLSPNYNMDGYYFGCKINLGGKS